jgi:uncharacterized surface protein with fasciclin (FAS1) repeats
MEILINYNKPLVASEKDGRLLPTRCESYIPFLMGWGDKTAIKNYLMRQCSIRRIGFTILIICTILLQSCNEEWNKHYKDDPSTITNQRIGDYIKNQPELTKFYELLTIAGYDTIINASQAYTVWAPVNSSLQNIDTNDTSLVLDIVKNHITRFTVPTSNIQSKYIRMLSGKLIHFLRNSSEFLFGNSKVTIPNIQTSNGIIHIIDNYVPFQNSIWDYIMRTEGMDSLKAFVLSQHIKVFNPDESIAVGIDSLGNVVYDSAFIETNVLLDAIGSLNSEDSVYTVILPNNNAWNKAYNIIKPYFTSSHPTKAAQIQRLYTQYSIVRDIVYRGRLLSPFADSLISTTGNKFKSDSIFTGLTAQEVSNGLIYVADSLPFKATESWHKTLKVEGETSEGRSVLNCNVYTRYSYGSPLEISRKTYILAEPTVTNPTSISKVNVTFSLPRILSAKYDIYCVFVPANIADTSDHKPYRISFAMVPYGYDGKPKTAQVISSNNITKVDSITKMLVAKDYSFPSCDVGYDESTPVANIMRLRVQDDFHTIQAPQYGKNMRIDCIILEPVK